MSFSGSKMSFCVFKCHFTSNGYMPFGVQRCHQTNLRTPYADLKMKFYGRYESFKMLVVKRFHFAGPKDVILRFEDTN